MSLNNAAKIIGDRKRAELAAQNEYARTAPHMVAQAKADADDKAAIKVKLAAIMATGIEAQDACDQLAEETGMTRGAPSSWSKIAIDIECGL